MLNQGNIKIPNYYYYGSRFNNIHHVRIRNKCSALNFHLFINHVKDSAMCSCSEGIEDAEHIFLKCKNYDDERNVLLHELSSYDNKLETLLFGKNDLSYNDNVSIFRAVHTFIHDSKRFVPP